VAVGVAAAKAPHAACRPQPPPRLPPRDAAVCDERRPLPPRVWRATQQVFASLNVAPLTVTCSEATVALKRL